LVPATIATIATVIYPSTHPTPVTPVTPRNFKPICPNGALGFGGSQALTCNRTNLAKTACPSGYDCVRAANVYDLYETPSNPKDDQGAADNPDVCCKKASIDNPSFVFTDKALTPNIVPIAPKAGIAAVQLKGPATAPNVVANNIIYLADDYSSLPKQLDAIPASATLYTNSDSTLFYHVLFFDATNNKDCFLSANNPGTDKPVLPFATPAAPTAGTPAAGDGATVYNAGPATSPVYKFSATYMKPQFNTAGHLFVMLIFETTVEIPFVVTAVNTPAAINAGNVKYGDFNPDKSTGGVFTTVTALLSGKVGKLLGSEGPPIAGTYFTLKI